VESPQWRQVESEQGQGRQRCGPWPGERTTPPEDASVQLEREITARKQAEARLEELRTELARLERVQTMGEMASGIAHELNQPLAVIVMRAEGAAQKLRLGRDEGKQQRIAELEEIANEAYRAGEIIRRMRDFVKKVEPHRSAVDLGEVVGEVVALIRNDLKHAGISFRADLDASLPKVQADKVQLQQVLLNLMRNAVEAMDQTGLHAHALRVRAKARNGKLEVAVSDTGCGVSDGELGRLFKRFQSTKPGGMGMGLAISRSIVEAHGGQIWARRNADRGTTFTFTLPTAHKDQ